MLLFQHAVMLAWVPIVVVLFAVLRPKVAVLTAYLLAWLFLPMANYDLPQIPDYTKMTATSYGVVLGILLFDFGRLFTFRPKWFDVPVAMFCVIAPIGAALANSPPLQLYDGLSESARHVAVWLLPYAVGRLYFTSLEDLRVIVVAVVAGALVYVPICWFEARFSPQLHRWVYGWYQHHFVHAHRAGGFRPRGFMQSGLMTATWVCSGALIAWCLWQARVKLRLGAYQVQAWWVVLALAATAVVAKGMGALILAFGGLCVLLASKWLNTRVFLVLLLCAPPVYTYVRAQDMWNAENLIALIETVSADRAQSLEFRVENDRVLADHAMQQPWFGWSGFNRSIVKMPDSKNNAVPDGMWIILLGKTGVVGLAGFLAALILPVVLFLRRFPATLWFTPTVAPLTAISIVLSLYAVDCLFNAMENPIFILMAGAMCSALASPALRKRAVPRRAAGRTNQAVPPRPLDDPGGNAVEPRGLPGGAIARAESA